MLQSIQSVGERSSITSMNPDEAQQPGFEAMDEAMDLTDSDSSHHGLPCLSCCVFHLAMYSYVHCLTCCQCVSMSSLHLAGSILIDHSAT